ncbi:uncharacterized protein [Triticum aestivum]|uniref:uncharacterized protein n=1 Tax=Triticum aestivum TaxID=4565 RepID=UPI001D00D9DE|nr:uncharacterized protein LOC123123726 [Triticum aestivum]
MHRRRGGPAEISIRQGGGGGAARREAPRRRRGAASAIPPSLAGDAAAFLACRSACSGLCPSRSCGGDEAGVCAEERHRTSLGTTHGGDGAGCSVLAGVVARRRRGRRRRRGAQAVPTSDHHRHLCSTTWSRTRAAPLPPGCLEISVGVLARALLGRWQI